MAPPGNEEVAQLPVINYSKLVRNDQSELTNLLSACETYGFFYLALDGVEGHAIDENHPKVLEFMRDYFSRELEVKMRDDRKDDSCGYEPVETSAGVSLNRKDFYESLKIPRRELLSPTGALPESITSHKELFYNFSSTAHEMTMTILARLSSILGLKKPLGQFHRDDQPSTSTLSMFRYPKQTEKDEGLGHNKHTDIGTLTFLLCQEWGLQVLSPATNTWQYVRPKASHAIINVGDSLRYSIAYFLRPEDDVRYTDSNGRVVRAKDWHDEKFDVFRTAHQDSVQNDILTGGMEKNDRFLVRNMMSGRLFDL